MKSYEERLKYILECRDKQLELKKKRHRAILRCAAFAACFCFTVISGFQIFVRMQIIPKSDFLKVPPSGSINSSAYTGKASYETTIKETDSYAVYSEQHTSRPGTEDKHSKATETNTEYFQSSLPEQTSLQNVHSTAKPSSLPAGVSSAEKPSQTSSKTTAGSSGIVTTTVKNEYTAKTSVPETHTAYTVSKTTVNTQNTGISTLKSELFSTVSLSETKPRSTSSAAINTDLSESPCVLTSIINIENELDFCPLYKNLISEYLGTLNIDGINYHLADKEMPVNTDEKIMDAEFQTAYIGRYSAKIFKIDGVPRTQAVAVWFKMGSGYYIYES